jgi:Holliday junction resolvase RusA-like endonuclease
MVAVARAYLARPAFLEPVELTIVAVFPCPRSERRKRKPAQRRPHALWPDADNVGKAVMDAGKGVLWQDDGQVARLVVEKLYGAQDEEPRVEVLVRPLLAAG